MPGPKIGGMRIGGSKATSTFDPKWRPQIKMHPWEPREGLAKQFQDLAKEQARHLKVAYPGSDLANRAEMDVKHMGQADRAAKLAKAFGDNHAKAAWKAAGGAAAASARPIAMTAAKVLGPIGVVAASEKAAGLNPTQEASMMQASMRDPNSFYNTQGPGSVKRPAYPGQGVVSSLMGVKNPKR